MTLGLFFWPGAGDLPAALRELAAAPGAERWVGRMMPSRSGPPPPDEPYHLLLVRMTGGQAVPPCPPPLRRWIGESLTAADDPVGEGANGLLINAMNIGPGNEEEFNDWYETEHQPRLRAVEGVRAALRLRSDQDQPRYCALYYLRDLDVLAGAAWREAAVTPWTTRILGLRSDSLRMGFTRAEPTSRGQPRFQPEMPSRTSRDDIPPAPPRGGPP